ncbi:hypothetical protein IG193_01370 [Infirmifilum lucidum]|uniref:B3/B4 tRNA-binding domain-containing protein n=1 Tax=Infirmifilum lucidum TaxID=2776706 RepID=A0A7L9FH65_9CREN|nr:phenylalanine--tRNA ligase beta subunit-related protein [Infirmifilum lucidum]QOJ79140.1 hypothetical protein IG193_01370 [Infirmifilum lucidum]
MSYCGELEELVRVDQHIYELGVEIAYTVLWLDGSYAEIPPKIIERAVSEVRNKYRIESLPSVPEVRAYRDFYWRIGIDPTKTRPSSEALVRRVLRGEYPRINALVDAGNVASIETLVPIGIYDLEKAAPPLLLTLSKGGEVFSPLGGREELLPPGLPILVDSRGLVMHLYPHRDSRLTCVLPETRLALVVGGGVPGILRDRVVQAVRRVVEILSEVNWKNCGKIVLKASS